MFKEELECLLHKNLTKNDEDLLKWIKDNFTMNLYLVGGLLRRWINRDLKRCDYNFIADEQFY